MAAVQINADACIGCGQCAKECACACISLQNGKATFADKGCMKCGHCFAICPTGAVELFGEHAETRAFDVEKVEDAVFIRRSVRQFSGALDEEYIRDLINKTKYCASACNFRPLKFLVINRPKIDEIAPIAAELLESKRPGAAKMQEKFDLIFRGAPHVIITYTDNADLMYGSDEDAAIALSTLELLCMKDGVGTFWAGFVKGVCEAPQILELLGLQGKKVYSCMGIGKSAVKYCRPAAREDVDIKFI